MIKSVDAFDETVIVHAVLQLAKDVDLDTVSMMLKSPVRPCVNDFHRGNTFVLLGEGACLFRGLTTLGFGVVLAVSSTVSVHHHVD